MKNTVFFKSFLLAVSLGALAGNASAVAYVTDANITSVSAETSAPTSVPSTNYTVPNLTGNQAFHVFVDKSVSGVASCATQTSAGRRFAADPQTAIGRAQIATVLMAHAAGRKVSIYGTGTCDVWTAVESIGRVVVGN